MTEYPPYVNAYGKLPYLFDAIRVAAVPPKFNKDFMSGILNLKSSSYNAMIPFLKRIDFLDQSNVPTEAYRKFREEKGNSSILASKIREAYSDLYSSHEYAHRLSKDQVNQKLKAILGVSEDDKILQSVVGTFMELVKLSDFEGQEKENKKEEKPDLPDIPKKSGSQLPANLGLNYTINITLPATTDIEVFNAIFKSLKEHILSE